jgi:cell division ATPase FtsA
VVLTGGCANLVGCATFIKELSGYNVRIGYPRHKFSASGCQGILETSATACAGMVLAAKNDHIVSCIEEPLAWTEESEAATEEPVAEETGSYVPYETYAEETPQQETYEPQNDGVLFDTSDFIVPKEERKEKKKDKKKEKPSIIWNFISKKARNIVDSMGDLYENMSDEQI